MSDWPPGDRLGALGAWRSSGTSSSEVSAALAAVASGRGATARAPSPLSAGKSSSARSTPASFRSRSTSSVTPLAIPGARIVAWSEQAADGRVRVAEPDEGERVRSQLFRELRAENGANAAKKPPASGFRSGSRTLRRREPVARSRPR